MSNSCKNEEQTVLIWVDLMRVFVGRINRAQHYTEEELTRVRARHSRVRSQPNISTTTGLTTMFLVYWDRTSGSRSATRTMTSRRASPPNNSAFRHKLAASLNCLVALFL